MEPLIARPIIDKEIALINYLLSVTKDKPADLAIPTTVYTMNDGSMGSIRLVDNDNRYIFLRELVEAHYIDEDGIPVSISLNLSTDNKLFELNIFKGDFSLLRRYPTPETVRMSG